jgi:hypothetical protein
MVGVLALMDPLALAALKIFAQVLPPSALV